LLTEAPLKAQTNSAENEENNDRLLNTGVVADTGFSHILEEMPLDEFNTSLETPESIERASLLNGDRFEAFQQRKRCSGRKLTAPESRAERGMGGFEWCDAIAFLGYLSLFFHKSFEYLLSE